ncbi:MAG: DUF2147 domain-containing protein [Granulosicoccus sp.]
MHYHLPLWLKYGIATAYAYGAAVHVANITGSSGFDWHQAPLRWQALDVIYLVLDVCVVWGLIFRIRTGLIVFAIAAMSQIVLYTVFRDWVLDVPPAFVPSMEEQAYLSKLVAFHVVTLAAVMFALLRHRKGVTALLLLPLLISDPRPVTANTTPFNGAWGSPGLAMVVRFEPCEEDIGVICGRLVWSWDGDVSLKHKIGSLVLREIKADGENWRGSLIDPSTGRTYRGTLQIVDKNTLHLRGCFGPFCQSQTWRSLDSVTEALLGILGKS